MILLRGSNLGWFRLIIDFGNKIAGGLTTFAVGVALASFVETENNQKQLLDYIKMRK